MSLFRWFAHLPVRADLMLYTVIPALAAVGLHFLFRRKVKPHELLPHHEVAGFLISVVGVIYAVVLGFIVVTVWVAFDSAQGTADLEASDVAEIFDTARAFPEPDRARLQRLMADYAFEVRDREWPMLAAGRQDLRARRLYLEALPVIASERNAEPSVQAALRHFALQQSALQMLRELSLHRRERVIAATSGHLPAGFYFALAVGGVIVLAFVFLFGVDNQTVQLTMTGLITALMGLLFGLIVSLDRPYQGGIRVSSDAWTLVIENNHLADYRSKTTVAIPPAPRAFATPYTTCDAVKGLESGISTHRATMMPQAGRLGSACASANTRILPSVS